MAFKYPSHPDDFGNTLEGYKEWMKKNNPEWTEDAHPPIPGPITEPLGAPVEAPKGAPATPVPETTTDSADPTRTYLRPYLNDQVVVDVLEMIKKRADEGMAKYGTPMTRTDIDTVGWLRHAQEEALDLALYLERIIRDLGPKKT